MTNILHFKPSQKCVYWVLGVHGGGDGVNFRIFNLENIAFPTGFTLLKVISHYYN